MAASRKLPIVAIVGRANVGKSSLFNAILERREAIVAREAGTTRDSISAKADFRGQQFWIVDTAGMKDPEDDFEESIQDQIFQASSSADVIVVVTEAGTAISEEDRQVATLALKTKKPVILVVNKVDRTSHDSIYDYAKLGIKDILATSVTQGSGIYDLLEHISASIARVPAKKEDERVKIALLGRPNVGKSSLFNSMLNKQQALVAARAGTTRDINRAIIRYRNQEMELLDTAGIRRSGKIERGVEHFSVLRALSAIEEADICLLLVDATEPNVAQDQRIAGMIKDAGKGLVLVLSKWDAISDQAEESFNFDALIKSVSKDYEFVAWAPLMVTSSISGQNVTKLFDLILKIKTAREITVPTHELNNWLVRAVREHPPAGLKNHMPKLNYMVQETDNPIPAFKIFGSQTRFIHWSYRRYLENKLRDNFGYFGNPIQIWFIDKHATKKDKAKGEKD